MWWRNLHQTSNPCPFYRRAGLWSSSWQRVDVPRPTNPVSEPRGQSISSYSVSSEPSQGQHRRRRAKTRNKRRTRLSTRILAKVKTRGFESPKVPGSRCRCGFLDSQDEREWARRGLSEHEKLFKESSMNSGVDWMMIDTYHPRLVSFPRQHLGQAVVFGPPAL